MKKLNCYILDDEQHAIDVLKHLVGKMPGLNLAGYHTDPSQAIHEMEGIDLLFLDIDMPELNGLTFAALRPKGTDIIFTTSHREYGPEAYEQHAKGYLLKPIAFERFLKCVNEIIHMRKSEEEDIDHIFIKTGTQGLLTRVDLRKVLYFKGCSNYVEIHTVKEKRLAYLTLTELLESLPAKDFSRVHRSVIINHNQVQAIGPAHLLLPDGKSVPIGRTYLQDVRELFARKAIVTSR